MRRKLSQREKTCGSTASLKTWRDLLEIADLLSRTSRSYAGSKLSAVMSVFLCNRSCFRHSGNIIYSWEMLRSTRQASAIAEHIEKESVILEKEKAAAPISMQIDAATFVKPVWSGWNEAGSSTDILAGAPCLNQRSWLLYFVQAVHLNKEQLSTPCTGGSDLQQVCGLPRRGAVAAAVQIYFCDDL